MDQGDIDIFHLHILLFEPPVGHNEENDINRDDFPGIVLIVEFENEFGLLMHVEVRLPLYMTALNPNIGLMRTRRALRELLLYQWTPDTAYSPLVSMLTWQTDLWGVTVHAAGESSTLGFILCILITHQQHMRRFLWMTNSLDLLTRSTVRPVLEDL